MGANSNKNTDYRKLSVEKYCLFKNINKAYADYFEYSNKTWLEIFLIDWHNLLLLPKHVLVKPLPVMPYRRESFLRGLVIPCPKPLYTNQLRGHFIIL